MSIRVKLTIIFLVLAAVPMLFVSLLTVENYKISLEESNLRNLNDIVSLKANIIEGYFKGLNNNIKLVQGLYSIKSNFSGLSEKCKDTNDAEYQVLRLTLDEQLKPLQYVRGLESIILIDKNGTLVYSTDYKNDDKDIGKPVERDNLLAFKGGKKDLFYTEIFIDKSDSGLTKMLVSAPAYDFRGIFVGVIVFEIDMITAYGLVADVTGIGRTGEVLIGKKYDIHVRYISPLKYEQEPGVLRTVKLGSNAAFPIQLASSGKTGSGESTDYRGQRVVAAWKYIPSLGWGIVAKVDATEAEEDILRVEKLVAIIFFVILFLSAIIAFSTAHAISKPIQLLSRGAEMIGKGSYNHKVEPGTNDEIGRLSESFNQMTRSLEESRANLIRSQEELAQSKRLSDIGTLAATVAHELRNPLAAISLGLHNIKNKVKDPSLDRNFERMNLKIKESDEIINNLLFYSKIREPHLKDVYLDEIIAECVEIAEKRYYRKKNKVKLNLERMLIAADENQLKSVINNLLNNAYDAIEDDGEITVRMDEIELKNAEFSVSDNGGGISKEDLQKVFDPFFSTKAKGTGLGLSICKQIVELHHGSISINSEPKKGTTVTVRFPEKK